MRGRVISRVQLVLSARDIGVIEEALQDSVVHWKGAADHNAHLAGLLASLCDPTYDRKVSSLTLERARLERIVKQRRDTLARLRKAKEAGKYAD